MNSEIQVSAVSLNTTPMAFEENAALVIQAIKEAKANGVQIVCFPELCLCGYGCEDFFFNKDTVNNSLRALKKIMALTQDITAVVGLPYYYNGHLYNTAAIIQNKKLLGLVPKKVLARSGVHYEPRWFTPWPREYVAETQVFDTPTKIGDIFFRLGSVNIGIDICEEAWSHSPPSSRFAGSIDILLNPSASHFALGKYTVREHLVANASRAQTCLYVYANLMGLEAGRLIYDGGNLFAFAGKIIGRGSRFSFKDYQISKVPFNLDVIRSEKLSTHGYEEQSVVNKYQDSCIVDGSPLKIKISKHGAQPNIMMPNHPAKTLSPEAKPLSFPRGKRSLQTPKNSRSSSEKKFFLPSQALGTEYTAFEFEEFLQAEALALFDYLRKTKSKGYVVPLSGGADSSTVLVLIADMLALASEELGMLGFCQKIWPERQYSRKDLNTRNVLNELVAAVYMATKQNSKKTLNSARELCKALGIQLLEGEIDPLVSGYENLFKKLTGTSLTWEKHDLAKQNLQARVRGPLAWILANLRSAILITTSNRSEAAVGYATMDGDMSGGLAPLGGISKSFIKHFLCYHADRCELALGKIAALEHVISLAPSAELRPKELRQEDEKDLMPYDVLNFIEIHFLAKRLTIIELKKALMKHFPVVAEKQIDEWMFLFIRLWQKGQWKRERMAPSFHLENMSQDPKYAARYPILCHKVT